MSTENPNSNGAPEPSFSQEEKAAMEKALQELAEKAEKAEKEALYIRAEHDNQRKRLLREQEQSIRFANEKIVRDLLPALDLLERALKMDQTLKNKKDSEVDNFLLGIQMTSKEFMNILSKHGVELVGKVGDTFDPQKHEAVSEQPVEPQDDQKVLSVASQGCMMQGRLIRPAAVVVGRSNKGE